MVIDPYYQQIKIQDERDTINTYARMIGTWKQMIEVEKDDKQNEENEINTQINKQRTNNQQTTNNKQGCKELKNNIYTSEFLTFYNSYPKHVGKADAWKAWKKHNGNLPPVDDLISKINEFKETEDWKKENGKFIPHPATWLNGKRWEDELKIEKKETW